MDVASITRVTAAVSPAHAVTVPLSRPLVTTVTPHPRILHPLVIARGMVDERKDIIPPQKERSLIMEGQSAGKWFCFCFKCDVISCLGHHLATLSVTVVTRRAVTRHAVGVEVVKGGGVSAPRR